MTLADCVPNKLELNDGVLPFLENAADVVMCGRGADALIIFNVPQLVASVELLCACVLAQWAGPNRSISRRAKSMLRAITATCNVEDAPRCERLVWALRDASPLLSLGLVVWAKLLCSSVSETLNLTHTTNPPHSSWPDICS